MLFMSRYRKLLTLAVIFVCSGISQAEDISVSDYFLEPAKAQLVSHQTNCDSEVSTCCNAPSSDCSCGLVDSYACGAANLSCGCMSDCCDGDCCSSGCWLTRFLKPSDECFDEFISPMTNPVYFEDPRNLTEVRTIFIHHQVPNAAGGGTVQLFAAHIRAKLTERLSLIATKDGYITSSNALIDDGWADLNLGLKYTLFSDPCCQRILAAGMRYELPAVGSSQSLQGNGSGMFDLFLSGGAEVGDGYHYLTGFGIWLPVDNSAESQLIYWSQHLDHRIGCSNFYWLTEANWYHYIKSGDGGINGVEGGDLFNLGSTGVAGSDIFTAALGLKYKPSRNLELGFVWEAPLTNNKDVLDNRMTTDLILRY